jgi:hypothetical protein
MANSNAAHLEELKMARDAITAAIIDGRLTVEYTIRGRKHRMEASTEALQRLEEMIQQYEERVLAVSAAGSRFTLASLSRPTSQGSG